MIGLFYKRSLIKRLYSAKETYHFKEPAHRSHPIVDICKEHASICSYIHRYIKV